jgi:hypothetical protein
MPPLDATPAPGTAGPLGGVVIADSSRLLADADDLVVTHSFSAGYRLAPPALDEHGARIRQWPATPRDGDRG